MPYITSLPACQEVASEIREKIDEFRPSIPLIQGLRNPGMRARHWELLSDRIHMNVKPKANLTFSRCLELGLQDHVSEIAHVAEVAGKEYAIEQVLDPAGKRSIQKHMELNKSSVKYIPTLLFVHPGPE